MPIDKSVIQVWKIHVRGALASDARGIMLELSASDEALRAAGIPEGTKLPPFRFVLIESLATQLAAAIPRHLGDGGGAPQGETIH